MPVLGDLRISLVKQEPGTAALIIERNRVSVGCHMMVLQLSVCFFICFSVKFGTEKARAKALALLISSLTITDQE